MDDASGWATALTASRLPIAYSLGKTPRPRSTLAATLPSGVSGEAELADLVLTERLTIAEVRSRLAGHLPDGHRLIDLFDVWLGAPTVIAQLAAADYRVAVLGATTTELAEACRRLLAATTLERSRTKGGGRPVPYDLRPLMLGLEVADARAVEPPVTLRMRLRLGPDGPPGRPDEVVLALSESVGHPLELGPIVRERLVTKDMLEDV